MRFSPLALSPACDGPALSPQERERLARRYVDQGGPAGLADALARALPPEQFENLRALIDLGAALSARDFVRANAAAARLSFADVAAQIEAGRIRQTLAHAANGRKP